MDYNILKASYIYTGSKIQKIHNRQRRMFEMDEGEELFESEMQCEGCEKEILKKMTRE